MHRTYLILGAILLPTSLIISELGIQKIVLAEKQTIIEKKETPSVVLPLDELRDFSDVYAHIKRGYVENVTDEKLLTNAIHGMMTSLDPHSAYLDKTAYKELQIGTTGEFGGLGIEVGMDDGLIKVISPIDDTPAQRAGVMAGDLIIRLDDKSVKGLTLDEAVKIMRGKKGTSIVLTIIREGNDKPLKITVKRDVIKVKSVKSEVLEPGFGYLRISNFQIDTSSKVRNAIEKLNKENGDILKGLVIDLRNNPGGILTGAIEVSDQFLGDNKLIVYTEGRADETSQKFNSNEDDSLNGAPIVVLINQGSASASEIVAGALQDHKRAIVMGRRSFGKGSVQTIVPLNGESALKLTTARYFTPLGRSIQASGIEPDILLNTILPSEIAKNDDSVKESNLKGHLKNNGDEKNTSKKSKASSKLLSEDNQISEALNVLRGLQILSKNKT